jgi:serine/threonine-protein kinase
MAERIFLGRYHAVRLLGEGSMGQAYLARQTNPDRQVVVKVMHKQLASDSHYREAFRREIDFMSRFRHRCAVDFYEASMDDPQGPCVVMDYIDGVPLDELLRRHGRFPPPRVGKFLGDMCSVLQAAHAEGIIHRDLKPANLMVLEADTPAERLKVLDFGVARQSVAPSAGMYVPLEKFTASDVNVVVGTPEFICPELFRSAEMDHRGDLYSVGVILFQLLTGRLPFEYKTLKELMAAHLYEKPPTLAQRGGFGIRPAVEAVVQACLAKDPADRPQSARELVALYEVALGLKIWNEPEPPPPKALPTAPQPAARVPADDPHGFVWKLEAWMTEQVAAIKLRGFLRDLGGEVTDSQPGLICIHLRRSRIVAQAPAPRAGLLARLTLAKQPKMVEEIELVPLEVYMEPSPSGQAGRLLMTVDLRPGKLGLCGDPKEWRAWCERKLMDLSSYLMAKKIAG